MMRTDFNLYGMRDIKAGELPSINRLIDTIPPRSRPYHRLKAPAQGKTGIIAEVKKASPSMGSIRDVRPRAQALLYASGGAAAVSVLTDASYFSGSWTDLKSVSDAVDLPVLCKEFVYHEEQVRLAERCGADLLLLINRVLAPPELEKLYTCARDLGLTPLIEVHDEDELPVVLGLKPKYLMVNMRDLRTLRIDFATGMRTLNAIPEGVIRICASGVTARTDITRLRFITGTRFFLVGSSLMSSPHPESMIRELSHVH